MKMIANRYRVVSRIGRGAFKEVFRAVDTRDGTDVAVAVMPYISRDDFEREVAAAKQIRAKHVVRILDSMVDDRETGYLVMEYCDGENLADLVNRGVLTMERAAPIMLAFARALQSIHEGCVLHRDVKLENVIVSTSGAEQKLWVIDFGLSARSASSVTAVYAIPSLAGTLPYMAPEVVSGRNLDARCDVYAFGVCCFRMLTGKLPIDLSQVANDFEALERVRDLQHNDVSPVPERVRALVGRMLAPARDTRPYMPEVVAELERLFGASPPVVARDEIRRPRPSPLGRSIRIRARGIEASRVLVAPCGYAPIVTIEPGPRTRVHALTSDGAYRWGAELDGRFTTGLRADLDGDGVRELYLAGPTQVAAIDARGCVRYTRDVTASAEPTLLAVGSQIVVDGATFESCSGAAIGRLPHAY
ncbi:MAG TPA: serine/threonine-protein kinase, partial [Kofleriaceae bacterium]|nr:serine/threonine-protein kinase [Kofleriaceae bacterium]